MSAASGFGLRAVNDRRLLRHWGAGEPLVAARRVAAQIAPGVTVLPLTRITSSVVFPMVQLLPAAAALRRASGALAVTDPAKLLSLLEDPAASVTCPPPVEIRGFISPLQVRAATGQLSGLRGLGRTVVVVPSGVDVDDGALTTLDLQGTAVFRDASIPELLVPGDGGPREGSRYDTAFLRMRQEQLFGWMLASAA